MPVPAVLLLLACVPADPEDTARTVTAGTPEPDLVADTTPFYLSTSTCAACGGACTIDELAYAARYHTSEPIDYADRPPAGGPHNPCWAAWGVHETEVADDNWVHNLEHGGVVFLHDCEGCEGDVDGLVGLTTGLGEFTLVTPYPDMATPFAVVAWGWRLTTGCFDPATAEAFYADHVDQGPESSMADPVEGCM